MKAHKIEFEKINLENNRDAKDEMIKVAGHMGVPVTVIDGEVIVGFDRDTLSKKLSLKE